MRELVAELVALFAQLRQMHEPAAGWPIPWCAECQRKHPCRTWTVLARGEGEEEPN